MTDAALAALLGGLLVSGLTELVSRVAKGLNLSVVPAWVKTLLAAALASGAVNLGNLHVFTGTDPWTTAANAVVVWCVATLIHDVGLSTP